MSPHRTATSTFQNARKLRSNLTLAEKRLWSRLRAHRLAGAGFRRQHPIGPFIVDFCAPRQKIIVELDGGQHAEQKEKDEHRTKYFEEQGYKVLRFWNNEVLENMDWVLEKIAKSLESPDGKECDE